MTLVADADVEDPVIRALQAVRFDIVRYKELGLPARPDRVLMARILSLGGVLVTKDLGIPSQAYLFQYAQHGLTVVTLRWKQSRPTDWQEMVVAILRWGKYWEQTAAEAPSIISVNRRESRSRSWSTIPSSIAERARVQLEPL